MEEEKRSVDSGDDIFPDDASYEGAIAEIEREFRVDADVAGTGSISPLPMRPNSGIETKMGNDGAEAAGHGAEATSTAAHSLSRPKHDSGEGTALPKRSRRLSRVGSVSAGVLKGHKQGASVARLALYSSHSNVNAVHPSQTGSAQGANGTHSSQNAGPPPPCLHRFLNSSAFSALMMVTTVFALFGDDLRLTSFHKPDDDVFYGLASASLFLFSLEFVLSLTVRGRAYAFSFYFWLDLMATLSVLPDIGWLFESDSSGDVGAARAGRASRAGARAGRVVRIVRLVRLVRIVKLLKVLIKKRMGDMSAREDEDEDGGELMEGSPTMVGKRLSEQTTRYVIVLVLAMLFLLPVFDGTTEVDEALGIEKGLVMLHRYPQDRNVSTAVFEASVQQYVELQGLVMHLSVCPGGGCAHPKQDPYVADLVRRTPNPPTGWSYASHWRSVDEIVANYRSAELIDVATSGCFDAQGDAFTPDAGPCISFAYFDNSAATRYEALMSIFKTLFIMVVLAGGTMMFTTDAEVLVISPIERMIRVVKELAENPILAIERRERERRQREEEEKRPMSFLQRQRHTRKKKKEAGYETALLEHTLSKIGALLQVGFGTAGARIISENMGANGTLNPMVPGTKVWGVYAFCDIRQFTDTTECLEEQVMVFVNRVGAIAHGAVNQLLGAPNKNVGDAFLFVWKLPDYNDEQVAELKVAAGAAVPNGYRLEDGLVERDGQNAAPFLTCDDLSLVERREDPDVPFVVDNALAAVLKIQVETEHSNNAGDLKEFQDHPRIRQRFPDGYKVRLGFGIHVGWSIEGAIGSRYKVDASYLSDDVKMSERLEEATKHYGVPILLTEQVHFLLSAAAQARCRRVDRVAVPGTGKPFDLYTFDIARYPPTIAADPDTFHVDFSTDEDVVRLQDALHPDFVRTFERGVKEYVDGDWTAAKAAMERVLTLKMEDGPTRALLRVMAEHEFAAPLEWLGYRDL